MIRSFNQTRDNYFLTINGLTWKKKYYNLFDYDQKQKDNFIFFKQSIKARQSYFLIFKDKKTFQLKLQPKRQLNKIRIQDIQPNKKLICGGKIITKDKYFQIKFYQPDQILHETKIQLWLENQHLVVVRSLKNQQKQPIGYRLETKNIIKLGNRQFFIHSIVKDYQYEAVNFRRKMSQIVKIRKKYQSSEKQGYIEYLVNNNQTIYDATQDKYTQVDECKYCIMNQSQVQGDFLCSPCNCTGSCGLVHFHCLVKWNQNKVKKSQTKGLIQYNFDKFFCQVCKEQYPQYIQKDDQILQLLPIQRPSEGYMILEDFYSNKRHVIIIKAINQSLIIGRSNQCDLKIQQTTISRRHAQIKRINGDYFIFDLKSKYGTLVKQPNLNIILRRDQKFTIQAANTLLTFSLQDKQKNTLYLE